MAAMNAFWKGFAAVGEGMARIFDFSGEVRAPLSDEEAWAADARALESDWKTVLGGEDGEG